MNIDVKELKKQLRFTISQEIVEKAARRCEIAPVDCTKCAHWELKKNCFMCPDNPAATSLFEQKRDELANLFIGAPVAVKVSRLNAGAWKIQTYHGGVIPLEGVRLPTLEESPRNTWLAPPLDMPEGIERYKVLLLGTDGRTADCAAGMDWSLINWGEVQAFQIMEDFKK